MRCFLKKNDPSCQEAKRANVPKWEDMGGGAQEAPKKSCQPMALGGLEGPHYETTPRGRLVRLQST